MIGFKRDRSFNNVIDALLFIAIKDLPESTTKPVLKKYGMAKPWYQGTETYLEVDFRASSSALISLALFSEIS